MLCVIPFHAGDIHRVRDLLLWIEQLGGCHGHDCMLVMDEQVPWHDGIQCLESAGRSFRNTYAYHCEHTDGWIPGSVALFKTAAMESAKIGQPWLWLEPDATPLKEGWLDAIAQAYQACGKPFMGSIVSHNLPNLPNPYMEGVAVYPANAHSILGECCNRNQSWVFSCASRIIPNAINSPLFWHLWGEKNNPPIFSDNAVPGTAVHCLEQIPVGSFIQHRCKDGSLIRQLRKRAGIKISQPLAITVVFAFCGKDAQLMVKSLEWIAEIQPRLNRTAVLHYDGTMPPNVSARIRSAAGKAFASVIESRYPTPTRPYLGWPAACNWAFKQCCFHMEQMNAGPWLWFEADMAVVKEDWLAQIEAEYDRGGKPFMGTQIPDFDGLKMNHFNGTCVYPVNTPQLIPKALEMVQHAWDTTMKPEMLHLAHRANHIMQHCGAVVNGCCKPANGAKAIFRTQADVDRLVEPGAVTFHPSKDMSLVDRLRERRAIRNHLAIVNGH